MKMAPHCEQCISNEVENEILLSVDNLKKQVKASDEPIPKLYGDTLTKYENSTYDILTSFPSYSNLKHSLYNARNQSLGTSKSVFRNLEEIEVPLKFHNFLLADYYKFDEKRLEATRIIVFCSLKARDLIGKINEFFADGTFDCCPKPFVQLFSIFGENGSTNESTNAVPLVYALLSDKKQSTYFALFEILKSQLNWDPQILHCDFEMSILNSIEQFCPTVKIVGCYYHWSRCIWRKAKKLGISKTKSKRDKRTICLCSVLPLLPSEIFEEGWNYIKEESNGANKLVQYIERYWIQGNFEKFSSRISVFSQRHRTNNVLESFHAKLSRRINSKNVIMVRLLNLLEKFSVSTTTTQHKRRKVHIENDDYIREIQLQLITGNITVGHALEKLRC